MTTPPLHRTTSEGKGSAGRLFTQHPPPRCWHCGGHRLKQFFQRILIDCKCPCCGSGSVRKTYIPTVLLLIHDFLSLKNDVNVPSKRKTYPDPQPDPNPDPLIKRIRIWIYTKISWISNTYKCPFPSCLLNGADSQAI
jgi:hypothetical protein